MVPSSVGLSPLRALPKKAQRRQGSRYGGLARHKSALDADGIARQGHPGRGYAGRPICSRLIADKAVSRVHLIEKVVEGLALQQAQVSRAGIPVGFHDLAACLSEPRKCSIALL